MSDNLFLELENFDKLDNIGSGGFGTVFKIKDKATGIIYAAKEFKEFEFDIKDEKMYFSREINIMAKLNHPSVLKFIGYSSTDFDHNP